MRHRSSSGSVNQTTDLFIPSASPARVRELKQFTGLHTAHATRRVAADLELHLTHPLTYLSFSPDGFPSRIPIRGSLWCSCPVLGDLEELVAGHRFEPTLVLQFHLGHLARREQSPSGRAGSMRKRGKVQGQITRR